MTNEDIKTYSEIAKPFVEPIISTILKPQLKKLSKWLKKSSINNAVSNNYFEDKFTQYLSRTYKNCSVINTLVFPNQQIKIKDVYYPLKIVSTKDNKHYLIDDLQNSDLLSSYRRILISDTAGMGKSTLMKWISLNLMESPLTIPILIELRKLDETNSIIDEIFTQIDPIDKSFDKDLIIRFLELGFFTIILDGFDEIPKDIQQETTEQLRQFINKIPENTFIMTSRPESVLSSFGDFQMFYIEALKPKESYEIIKKYDKLNQIKYADNLINEIKNRGEQVKDFLINPFLVSLLYKSYTFNKDIPSKKTTFYEEVYSSLFKHHDSSKDGFKRPKISGLDILDFRIILRSLAFETAKLGKVIYTEPELLNFISNSKSKTINMQFKEASYLEDLLTTVPLFLKEGHKIKWAHKSIQDYFSAEYITFHTKKEDIIKKIYSSQKDNYLNIIDLIYELDPKLFRKVILLSLLTEFSQHWETTYTNFPEINEESISDRKAKTFGISFCIINCNKNIGFDKARKIYKNALHVTDSDFYAGATQLMGHNIFIMSSYYFKYRLIETIGYKNENLFIETSRKYLNEYKNIKQLSLNQAFIINDDPSSSINKPEIFDEVNSLINHHIGPMNRSKAYLLDYKKVKKLITRIKTEIQIDESNEDLKDI